MADPAFDPLLAFVRALHAGAAMVLFGELLFATCVTSDLARDGARRRAAPVIAWIVAAASGAAWLGLEAMQMSGGGWAEAWRAETLRAVLGETLFGRAWLVRTLLLLALAPALVRALRGDATRTVAVAAAAIAAAFLAGIAWAGHANVETGANGAIHHGADALHLVAAGAWLGGLAPFAAALRDASQGASSGAATRVVARFGTLAAVCVGAIVASGVANAAYTLGSAALLATTAYGRVLSLKLVLFAALLALAAANRWRLTPALASEGREREVAIRRLRRHAWLEVAFGIAVVVAAAVLAGSAPPMRMGQ